MKIYSWLLPLLVLSISCKMGQKKNFRSSAATAVIDQDSLPTPEQSTQPAQTDSDKSASLIGEAAGSNASEGYATCIGLGYSPSTCSSYPDRGSNGGYSHCLELDYSPSTCSTYPDQGASQQQVYQACRNCALKSWAQWLSVGGRADGRPRLPAIPTSMISDGTCQ